MLSNSAGKLYVEAQQNDQSHDATVGILAGAIARLLAGCGATAELVEKPSATQSRRGYRHGARFRADLPAAARHTERPKPIRRET